MKKVNDDSQKAKFIAAAREHGCDESEEAFAKKLKKIAVQKPDEKITDAE